MLEAGAMQDQFDHTHCANNVNIWFCSCGSAVQVAEVIHEDATAFADFNL